MKTVTSEGNLAHYLNVERGTEMVDPVALNRKIKAMKSALKLSQRHNKDLERHNKELHIEIKNLKEASHLQRIHLQNECRQYKQLYQILSSNYELRGLELKECKRNLKRIEADQGVQLIQEAEETARQYRETIVKQEKELARLREENSLLYDQLYEKSLRVKELEPFANKSYSCKNQKDKTFLASLRNALEIKNQEFEKLMQEKNQLNASKILLERENTDLNLKLVKVNAELECERRNGGDSRQKLERECEKLKDEIATLSGKYNQLLAFSFEVQKDFERELQSAMKQMRRKENKQ